MAYERILYSRQTLGVWREYRPVGVIGLGGERGSAASLARSLRLSQDCLPEPHPR